MSCLWQWCCPKDPNKATPPKGHRNQPTQELEVSQVAAGMRFENSDIVEKTHSDIIPERDNVTKVTTIRIKHYNSAN